MDYYGQFILNMSDLLPVYSDSDSDTENCEKEQKESYDSTAANPINVIDAVETATTAVTLTSSVPTLKWMNPEESASSSSEDEGSSKVKVKSELNKKKHNNSLALKPTVESSVRNPNSLLNLMNVVKDRPSFLQSKIKEKFQIASIKRHDYDQKKEIVDISKTAAQQKQPAVALTAASEKVVSKDDNSSAREVKSAAAHSKAADSRKDAKLRKATDADKETAKVRIMYSLYLLYT